MFSYWGLEHCPVVSFVLTPCLAICKHGARPGLPQGHLRSLLSPPPPSLTGPRAGEFKVINQASKLCEIKYTLILDKYIFGSLESLYLKFSGSLEFCSGPGSCGEIGLLSPHLPPLLPMLGVKRPRGTTRIYTHARVHGYSAHMSKLCPHPTRTQSTL